MTHYKCSVLKNVERVVFQINVTFCLKKKQSFAITKISLNLQITKNCWPAKLNSCENFVPHNKCCVYT